MSRRGWLSNCFAVVVLLAAASVSSSCRRETARDDAGASAPGGTREGSAAAEPVQDYARFAATLGEGNTGIEQLVEGLRKLAGAVGAATDGQSSA